jgi:sensor domain CHASE-containing protein
MSLRKIWKKIAVLAAAMLATLLGNAQSVLSSSLDNDEPNNIASRLERVRKSLDLKESADNIQNSKDKPNDRIAQWGDWYNGFRDWRNY